MCLPEQLISISIEEQLCTVRYVIHTWGWFLYKVSCWGMWSLTMLYTLEILKYFPHKDPVMLSLSSMRVP